MSDQFTVYVTPGDEKKSLGNASTERNDYGAAFNIITHDCEHFVVARSKEQGRLKLIGGKGEKEDCATPNGVRRTDEERIIAGAVREMYRESWIIGPLDCLDGQPKISKESVVDTEYVVLLPELRQDIGRGRSHRNFTFAFLKNEIDLAERIARLGSTIESIEMDEPHYLTAIEIINAGLNNTFNPYHAIAFCEWIKYFKSIEKSESPQFEKIFGTAKSPQFKNLLIDLYYAGHDPDRLIAELRDIIQSTRRF